MKLTGIRVPGMRIDKDGKLVKDERRYDVATQIKRRRGSKKVRVKKRQGIGFL
jgi:hypothetical protein